MTLRTALTAALLALLMVACSSPDNEQAAAAEAELQAAEEEWQSLIFAEYFERDQPIGGTWRLQPIQSESGVARFAREQGQMRASVDATEDSIWWNAPIINRPTGDDYIARVIANEPTSDQLRYGMVFWWASPGDYYSLLLGPNESVAIDRTLEDETANIFTSQPEPALQERFNTLTVLIFGDTANIYINNEWLTTITRANQGESFALAVEAPADVTGSVAFTSVEVLAP